MIDLIASTPIARLMVLLLVFALAVVGAMVLLSFVEGRLAVRGELRQIADPGSRLMQDATLHRRTDGIWSALIERIERTGLSLEDTKADALRERMRAAGFASPLAPRLYTLVRLGLIVALPLLFVLLTLSLGGRISILQLYLAGTLFAVVGLYFPVLYIRVRTSQRRNAVTNGFPDCLDLMLICVEAGLGLEAAMDRVARELTISHKLISELLATANLRLRAGASRDEALRRLADDAGVEEVRSFATLLIQSDKLGTGIGTTLRTYASEMRERRRMRAEEKAHRLPVLMSIPLVACMLPTMIGVLMLPAVIRVIHKVIPIMSGG
jgi:tight adherence protein C